jgi:pilus assembly protein TadC
MTWAAVLLAAALLLAPGRARARLLPVRRRGVAPPARDDDALAVASSLDVFAACLSSGMAVATAAAATAPSAPPTLGRLLGRAADLLALGADPAVAWANSGSTAADTPWAETLLRLARRSAASGAALAQSVTELAAQERAAAADDAAAAAERAGVLIAGPLGVCYLPAFICLGIVPVVVGLAGDVLGSGML